jgi:cellulose synthase/poly-beta-1,6-N-acetylglucosamine synthase-like glycosyltransferase
MSELILIGYFSLLGFLAIYGLHRWALVFSYLKHRNRRTPLRVPEIWPRVTVQLPIYNELHVVERLVEAISKINYPHDRLQIQLLDDSDDETVEVAARAVARARALGIPIEHLRRTSRKGFKAGALAYGMHQATGEYIAIFDADFVPHPNFLRDLLPAFTEDRIGMVQARWGHLNRSHSLLTRVQAIFLDGHFIIEHGARYLSGRFFNFNGTAGIWRRTCIDDAGGWHHDTLTEDLDLSYRAQMKGWRFVYLPDVIAPAELPVEMSAFKSQQHRWAKGSIQTARKLLPKLWRSGLSFDIKLEATFHMTANLAYIAMLALVFLVVPAVFLRAEIDPRQIAVVDLPLFSFSTLSILGFYLVAEKVATGRIGSAFRCLPALMGLGIGLGLNNSRAVWEGVRGQRSPFLRTPKYNLKAGQSHSSIRYRSRLPRETWLELLLGIGFSVAIAAAIVSHLWGAIPFLLLFQTGFLYTALVALRQRYVSGLSVATTRGSNESQNRTDTIEPTSGTWPSAPVTTKALLRSSESTSPDPALSAGVATSPPPAAAVTRAR